jgi:1-acyl-sn-glycerol-3-phosphate acyltransferase
MLDRLRALLAPSDAEDAWGYDPQFARAFEPLLDALYARWWNVKVTGPEHVPAAGPALIVANRSAGEPWDGAMIATAMRRHGGRAPRALGLDALFALPWAGIALRRAGALPSGAANARRLLAEGHLVLVAPEESPPEAPYRVGRFGRGEFVEVALESGAPVVPCAVVAGGRLPLPAPLALPALPSSWRIEFGPPVDLSAYGPAGASDRRLVLEISDTIHDQLQAMVHENLIRRARSDH